MPASGRISLGSPELRGRVRVRDRSAYAFSAARPRRSSGSVDGIVSVKIRPRSHLSYTRTHGSLQAVSKPALPRQSKSAVLARHTVAVKRSKTSPAASKRSKNGVLLVFLSFALFFAGTAISYNTWQSKKKVTDTASVLASTNATEEMAAVSEDAVSEEVTASYAVAPEMPRLIKIPRLQVNARVKRIGVNTAGTLETPSNVHDAGWYEGSAKPGKNDTTLINGHVHGAEKPGVFSRLSILKEGDSIQIERGDNKVVEYKVTRTESIDQEKVDLDNMLTSGIPGKSSLVLMTSSSRYDVRTNKYEQCFVVYAVEQ